jgi:hypothetical protein
MLTDQRAGNPRPEINVAGVPTELVLDAGTAQMLGLIYCKRPTIARLNKPKKLSQVLGATIPASEFRAVVVVHADVAVHLAAEPLKDTQFVGGKNSAPIEPREPDRLDRCGARMG